MNVIVFYSMLVHQKDFFYYFISHVKAITIYSCEVAPPGDQGNPSHLANVSVKQIA